MLELNHGFRVTDANAWLPGDGSPAEESAESLEREMHQAGVVRSVVYPGPHGESVANGDYLRANNAIARGTVERPLIAFARLSGPRDPDDGATAHLRNLTSRRGEDHASPEEIEQYAYDDRFHGFMLDPETDGLPDGDTLDALGTVDLPVLVHASAAFPPKTAADALGDRGVPVILAHFGGHPLDEARMGHAVDLLAAHDDLYLDTSAVRKRTLLEDAIREHPDRILFGSGAPSVHPSVGVMEILTLDVPEDEMRRVFSKNAARVVDALGPSA